MPFITDEPALLAYLDEQDIPYTPYDQAKTWSPETDPSLPGWAVI